MCDCIGAMLEEQPNLKMVAAVGTGNNDLLKIRSFKLRATLLEFCLRSQNSLRNVEVIKPRSMEVRKIVTSESYSDLNPSFVPLSWCFHQFVASTVGLSS